MTPTEIGLIIAAITGGIGTVAGILRIPFDLRLQRKRQQDEGDASFADEARKLLQEKNELLARDEEQKRALHSSRERIEELTKAVRRLENLVPLALVSGRWLEGPETSDIGSLLDKCRDLFAITSAADGGTFIWVNKAWEKTFGYQRSEMLGTNWKNFVHPLDLKRTQRSEASAWGEEVAIVNRYRRKDGRWVQLRWYATRYIEGLSVALAKVEAIL